MKASISASVLRSFPGLLIAVRVILGPVTYLCLVRRDWVWATALYLAALLSDIYDGVIARRLGIVTLRLRLADGYADIFFFGWLILGIIQGFRGSLAILVLPFFLALGLILINWLFCFWRFDRITSYHSMMMKTSALGLFAGVISLLLFHSPGPLCGALCWLALAAVEEIAMTAVLTRYHFDVWNLAAALRLRRQAMTNAYASSTVSSSPLKTPVARR